MYQHIADIFHPYPRHILVKKCRLTLPRTFKYQLHGHITHFTSSSISSQCPFHLLSNPDRRLCHQVTSVDTLAHQIRQARMFSRHKLGCFQVQIEGFWGHKLRDFDNKMEGFSGCFPDQKPKIMAHSVQEIGILWWHFDDIISHGEFPWWQDSLNQSCF